MEVQIFIGDRYVKLASPIEAVRNLVRLCSPEEVYRLRTDELGQILREMTGNQPEPRLRKAS
jgi:hypothetical protein